MTRGKGKPAQLAGEVPGPPGLHLVLIEPGDGVCRARDGRSVQGFPVPPESGPLSLWGLASPRVASPAKYTKGHLPGGEALDGDRPLARIALGSRGGPAGAGKGSGAGLPFGIISPFLVSFL